MLMKINVEYYGGQMEAGNCGVSRHCPRARLDKPRKTMKNINCYCWNLSVYCLFYFILHIFQEKERQAEIRGVSLNITVSC